VTHRGPFQPRPFCDSVNITHVYTGLLVAAHNEGLRVGVRSTPRCLLDPAENGEASAGISPQTFCPRALAACASPVRTKCRPGPLESQRCCGSTERAPQQPADGEERSGPAPPNAACSCGCSPAPHGATRRDSPSAAWSSPRPRPSELAPRCLREQPHT